MANNQHHDYQYLSVTCSQVKVSIYQQKFPILYIDAYLNIYINYILNIPMINIEFPILYVYIINYGSNIPRCFSVKSHPVLVGGFNHLEKHEFVNGKDSPMYSGK